MKLEELKRQLPAWKESNAEFYNNYVHAIRDGKATLSAYMHIYDYAMGLISDLPQTVKFGSYGTIFKNYHYKLGFNGLLGMLLQVLENDKMLYFQAQVNREKLKMAILYWFLFDDYHFCLICKIRDANDDKNCYFEHFEKLEGQIISNSIILRIKNEQYWYKQIVFSKLILSRQDLEELLSNLGKKEPLIVDYPQSIDIQKLAKESYKKIGRPSSISAKTFDEYVSLRITNDSIRSSIVKYVLSRLGKGSGKDLALLVIAMEFCGIIDKLDGNKVAPFHVLLKQENVNICDQSNFSKPHRKYCGYLDTPDMVEKEERKMIDEYVKTFREILK